MTKQSHYGQTRECPHCGVAWTVHMGVSGTCRKLAIARKALNEIRKLNDWPVTDRDREIDKTAYEALEESK